ncbi:hypothetical protein CBR_g44520 [Chara braunii]|uniref:HAT C-terminal dimerisation domain-containing protein n=1 Tax=Chara braunii TaxID=69332 RepID=A0A388LXL3_CHABU|nr:hypothetical protein CBR_g44520 [Chara braunii]|eukprot:GBG87064.1 hypothetical protein CBR_g44520 [Chara braunii]
MRPITHVMGPVMDLLRRMDGNGQFMSLIVKRTRDLACLMRDACAPLGSSFSDHVMRRVQARIQHMMELAHCAAFLLNPRRRDIQYFSTQLDEYHTWLVWQAKRYLLSQTGFDESGARYLEVCRQFEDFHMQQGRYGTWGGGEGRARARSCSGDFETMECASWWSQYGGDAPDLQYCTLRVMHMWSCASPAERNRAVYEGIHTKKRNQLAFKKVVHLVEIIANVRLMEYRRANCGYVLPWQRDEGMLHAQAGLEVGPVRSGTRSGMTEEEIEEQVALMTRDPIGASAPPPVESVLSACAAIFRLYPRDDASEDERETEALDDPALPILCGINELHEEGDEDDERTHTARGVERKEAVVRVHDGEQVERVEGVLPAQVEREEDVVRTQVAIDEDMERLDYSAQVQREEGVVGAQVEREEDVVRPQVEREEGVAGVDDDAHVEIEDNVVRADAGVLFEREEGVVGGDVAHGRGEGSDNLDPIVQCFIANEMGPALEGLTPGTMRALGASPSRGRGASGMGMRDFMEVSLGDPPSPRYAELCVRF